MTKNKTQPKNWQKVKLGGLGSIITGTTPPTGRKDFFGGDFPFITPTDIVNFDVRYNYKTERFLTEKWRNKAERILIPEDAVCFVCIGSTIGKICLANKKSFTNQQINTFVANPAKANSKFIYYLLKYNQENIIKQYGGSGSGKEIINKSTFGGIEFLIPVDVEEQKRIAGILSVLDDKIELNNKINQNLEQSAQIIFKEWFVKLKFPGHEKVKMADSELGRIPGTWRVSSVGKELETILGGTPSTNNKEYWDKGNVPWINSGALNDFPIIKATALITELGLKKSAAKLMPAKTTVMPMVVSTGKTVAISILAIESSGNQSVVGIMGNDKISSEFVYFWIRLKKEEIYGNITGGAQQHINKNVVDSTTILIPDGKIMNLFNKIAKPIMDSIISNSLENQKLASLRDLLLPKLMSGEIRV